MFSKPSSHERKAIYLLPILTVIKLFDIYWVVPEFDD